MDSVSAVFPLSIDCALESWSLLVLLLLGRYLLSVPLEPLWLSPSCTTLLAPDDDDGGVGDGDEHLLEEEEQEEGWSSPQSPCPPSEDEDDEVEDDGLPPTMPP